MTDLSTERLQALVNHTIDPLTQALASELLRSRRLLDTAVTALNQRTPGALEGCLLAEVRKAYNDPGAWVAPWNESDWAVFVRLDEHPGRDGVAVCATEIEALERALEVAP